MSGKQRDKKVLGWRRGLSLFFLSLTVLLTFLLLLFFQSQAWRFLRVDTAGETLTLYALSSLNFFAFIVFAFILLRSLIKLWRERQALQIGAKLKTRLLFYFISVSLLPIIAMAVFSYLFLNRALEKWFSRLPETVIEEAGQVQKNALEAQTARFREKTDLIALAVSKQSVLDETFLREMLEKGNLSAIEIVSANNVILARAEKVISNRAELQEVLQTLRDGKFDEPLLRDGKNFDGAAAQIADGKTVIVVSAELDEKLIGEVILNSPFEFDKLKQTQGEVRSLGFTTLSLLTFLLIFASAWVAFQLGRNLTKPINALVEASGEITRGNFRHRIEVFAEDELAILVDSFNQMSAQLQENQQKLDENRQNLEERRNYIETVLQTLSTGVISLDAENRITTINHAAKKMFRLEEGDFGGLRLENLLNPENQIVIERLLNRAKRIGFATEQTVLLRENSDGNNAENIELPVALTATNLPHQNGIVMVIEDLTELINAQRAAAWQEVARRMAHEIKNPLTPIQLSAERIARRFFDSETHRFTDTPTLSEKQKNTTGNLTEKVIREGTQTILREVNSLKLMVDEFSRFARMPQAKLELGNVNEIAAQVADLYKDRFENVRIETELAENLPLIMLDKEKLKRVFVNLLENAGEALTESENGNQISIKTAHDKSRDLLRIEIADTGKGIAAQDFTRIFQPYFSTKGRGTGLGLAIVQKIITEHGGKIRALANQPKGAKFMIELPL